MKNTWNIVKGLPGTSHSLPPFIVDVNGHILTKPNDVANHFADCFVTKADMLRQKVDNSTSFRTLVQSVDDDIMRSKTCSMTLSPVCEKEVIRLSKVE